MPPPDAYHANLQRGLMLLEHKRAREAVPFFQAAIAANPEAAQAYAELARAWNEIPAERGKAIAAIDRAIGLAPNESAYQGRKGWILVCLGRYRAALVAAEAGLAIEPNCIFSLNSRANALTKLGRWDATEAACLRILTRDANDGPALNLLAQALRRQGRWQESRAVVAHLLAQMPNSAFGHSNAGYAALAAGDHLRANEHFREALRLDPHFDLARQGLLHSLVARNGLARAHLRISSVMRQPIRGWGRVIVPLVTLLLGGLFVFLEAERADPSAKVARYLFGAAVLGFIAFLYISMAVRLLARFLLIFDPVGRHALTLREKARASVPAVVFVVAAAAFVTERNWAALLILLGVFAGLLLSVLVPQWLDDRQKRRLEGD
jgi:tetratricopeptide (TPR) repeat protein